MGFSFPVRPGPGIWVSVKLKLDILAAGAVRGPFRRAGRWGWAEGIYQSRGHVMAGLGDRRQAGQNA
jgi:hypothetical protein